MTAHFASALSAHHNTAAAVGEVVGAVLEQTSGQPDLAVVTFTEHHTSQARELASMLNTVLAPTCLAGASASGIVGCGEGREHEPGLALWMASGIGDVRAISLDVAAVDGSWAVTGADDAELNDAGALLLWVDPYSFPIDALLAHLSRHHPHLAVVGGFASAGPSAGTNRLILGGSGFDARARSRGALGVLLPPGALRATVVSQGCRPIGQPWTVTSSHGNVIERLGGRPAWERLLDLMASLDERDRTLAMSGLHCGVLADDRALDPDRGDFLVRGVIGIDQEAGSVAITAPVPVGTVVQFHVRDSLTAGDDLERRLRSAVDIDGDRPHGALVFTCQGRGRAMFDTPHHDAHIVHRVLGPHHVGMMCAGEIGPVAGRTERHGFTASVAVF